MVSIEADIQNYVELAEKIGIEGIEQWEQVLERGQAQEDNIPAVWVILPSWDNSTHIGYE